MYNFILRLSLFTFLSSLAFSVELISLHLNDADGIPVAPYTIDTDVSVEGMVTAGTGIFSSANFEVVIQDETAGMHLFLPRSIPKTVTNGDYIQVTGKIKQYMGLTEIGDISDISILSQSNQLPEPYLLTCDDLSNSFMEDFSEPNESRLIRINNVRIFGGMAPNYTISDHTGECILFLDPDANLPVLQGNFDVIGILKQFDESLPYDSYYEIAPRSISDFFSYSGPVFIEQPREIAISHNTVTFMWTTDVSSTSFFKFGQTESYESGTIGDSSLVKEHIVNLSGLSPATLYRGKAVSRDNRGASESEEVLFITSSILSTGSMQVYFTKSIDSSYASTERANGNSDLAAVLQQRIDLANYSLDVCYYNLNNDKIRNALIAAYKRGVHIRLIHESDKFNANIKSIKSYGIPIIDDRFGRNSGVGLMHNKFVIIDYRDRTSSTDDWLWTGSANATDNGSYFNAENMLLIQDETICAAYTAEFNEMWGSTDDSPEPENSFFGGRKYDNTPHRFNIAGTWVEQYMSPSDHTEYCITRAVSSADRSVYFCIYFFSSYNILNRLQDVYFCISDFILAGVFESESISQAGFYQQMSGYGPNAWNPKADVVLDAVDEPYILHHKYLIIDAEDRLSDPIVITGSHNWTLSANSRNDENTLIIHSARITNLFLQEFAKRYKEAGGSATIPTRVFFPKEQNKQPENFRLNAYPNPFNDGVCIVWQHLVKGSEDKCDRDIRIRIFNIMGRKVFRKHIKSTGDQNHKYFWHGTDSSGKYLPSGLYICQLQAGNAAKRIKLLLIR